MNTAGSSITPVSRVAVPRIASRWILLKYIEEVKLAEAASLISTPLIDWEQQRSWCDLGAGRGTFTLALAQLLSLGSTIHAVDFDQKALLQIPDQYGGAKIRKVIRDIESPSLRLPVVNGVLMANTLHFIEDPSALLKRVVSIADRFLIVEYERSRPHRWVPYPVGFERLCKLFAEAGVHRVERVASRPSLFGGTMYSALGIRAGEQD